MPISKQGFRAFVSDFGSVVLFLNTWFSLLIAGSLPIYIAKSYAMFLCMFKIFYIDSWMLLLAIYYFMKAAGTQKELTDWMNETNEVLCTCMIDIAFYSQFGMGVN